MVKIYPFPEQEERSHDFVMTVDEKNIPLHIARVSAYPINRRWPGHQRSLDQTEFASFAAFGVSGKTPVTLIADKDFRNVVVRPLSKRIVPQTDGRKISFELPGPGQYTVELDGSHHALHIFADEIKNFEADPTSPAVLYFGPGIHEPGLIELHANQTLFIDAGAIVYGRVEARDAENIRIIGHGILDGSHNKETFLHEFGEEDRKRIEAGMAALNVKRKDTIRLAFCDNAVIDGIIIRDSLLYNIRPICCRDLAIHNVKLIGNWRYNSDGIDMHNCQRVHIDSCFVRTFDDCICIKGFDYALDPADMHHNGIDYTRFEDVLIEKCVLWCDWNTTLEFGAETRAEEICRVTFRNCDIIHNAGSACDITSVDYADIHDVLYEDIRIEETPTQRSILQKSEDQTFEDEPNPPVTGRAIRCISFRHKEYSGNDPRSSRIHDVTFRNISVVGRGMMGCFFSGANENCISGPIRLENLTFNGKRLTTATEAMITIKNFMRDITLDGIKIE